jgi:hypothetical protein
MATLRWSLGLGPIDGNIRRSPTPQDAIAPSMVPAPRPTVFNISGASCRAICIALGSSRASKSCTSGREQNHPGTRRRKSSRSSGERRNAEWYSSSMRCQRRGSMADSNSGPV